MTTHGKRVLVATDLSARTDRAVDRATRLAQEWGVRLIVLHVIEPESMLHHRPEFVDQAIRSALPEPGADVDILPAIGPAPTAIVEAAAAADCGLIVTGVARFNQLGDYFIGTAVDHVVRQASVPVLVVKQRPHRPYRSIMVATDYSSCSRLALLTAAELFPAAAIHLVHAYHVPYEGWLKSEEVKEDVRISAQAELDEFMADPAISDSTRARISTRLVNGETHTVLSNTAYDLDADLLVLGTRGCNHRFAAAVLGSTAEALLRCTHLDTLMVGDTK